MKFWLPTLEDRDALQDYLNECRANDEQGHGSAEQRPRGQAAVGERRYGHHDRRAEHVSGREPLDRVHVDVEVGHDGGERHVEVGLVERGEERRKRGDHYHEPGIESLPVFHIPS